MCWSLQVSSGSYALVVGLSAVLWCRARPNDRWYALFFLFVGQVQLCEALLWLDQACGGLNQVASKVNFAVVCLEPFTHTLIALYCTPLKQRSRTQLALAAASAAFSAAFAVAAGAGTADWCSRPCADGACGRHLKWNWTENINDAWRVSFMLFLVAPLATMQPMLPAAAGAAYGCATFAAAHILFNKWAAFESMWCWLAVGGFIVPLLLNRPAKAAVAKAHRRKAA